MRRGRRVGSLVARGRRSARPRRAAAAAASILDAKGSEADRIASRVVADVRAGGRGVRRRRRLHRLRGDAWAAPHGPTSSRCTRTASSGSAGSSCRSSILAVLAVVTVDTTSALRNASPDELRIDVAGKLWWWEVRYPGTGVVTANEIHVPAGHADRSPPHVRQRDPQLLGARSSPGRWTAIPGQPNDLRFTADTRRSLPGAVRRVLRAPARPHGRRRWSSTARPTSVAGWPADERAPLEPASEEAADRAAGLPARGVRGLPHDPRHRCANGTVGPDLTDVGSRERARRRHAR